MDKITIRPSSVDTFFNCPKQWFAEHIMGEATIPGARAAIGTAIHSAAEVLWTEAIASKKKDANLTKLKDAAIEDYREADKGGLNYDFGEDLNTSEATILKGVDAFVEDIVPFTDIPLFTEQRFSIAIDHPLVERVSGTVDYLSHDTLADLKTSKRKPVASGHVTQQSIYKLLAEENGYPTKRAVIQGVALLKTSTKGHILELEPNVPRAKYLINQILARLHAYNDGVDPNLLFPGNPKYYLCSEKYCNKYPTCEYINGVL